MARNRGRGLLWCVCVPMLLAGCSAAQRPPPNVLLIVVDTLRVDRLGYAGSRRSLTPFLDELAERGAAFRNAYTPAPWTPPAVASLLTSRYPLQHRIEHYGVELAESEVTLPEKLQALRYRTAGFSANLLIREKFGYAQGFDHWQNLARDPDEGLKPRAPRIRAAVSAWVREQSAAPDRRPLFLYLHYLDPHSPYDPPEPYRSRFRRAGPALDDERANAKLHAFRFGEIDEAEGELLASLYDGEVAYMDSELQRLFEELEETGFLDDAIVVFTSDHGEEFREHDVWLHGLSLYQAGVQVPLILVAPSVAAGRVVEESVSVLDVAATVLELLGEAPEPTFEGRSLLPLLDSRRESVAPQEIVLQLAPKPDLKDVRRHAWGIVRGSSKLLVDPEGDAKVYDLARSPNEARPSTENGAAAAELLTALEKRRTQLSLHASSGSEPVELGKEMRARLRALGYVVDETTTPAD